MFVSLSISTKCVCIGRLNSSEWSYHLIILGRDTGTVQKIVINQPGVVMKRELCGIFPGNGITITQKEGSHRPGSAPTEDRANQWVDIFLYDKSK